MMHSTAAKEDGKFEANFTSDIYSKLLNINFEPDGNIVLGLMKVCLPRCYMNMRHKGAMPRELVGIIKKIVKSFEDWKLLTTKNAATLIMRDDVATDDDTTNLITSGKKPQTK
jgi:hypothetical protein